MDSRLTQRAKDGAHDPLDDAKKDSGSADSPTDREVLAVTATRTALNKARRGAAFLDGRLGRGWRRKIRRRDLDMASYSYERRGDCGCILAQIYGDYVGGVRTLGITPYNQRRLGLESDNFVDYDDLTEAWREVLRES